MFGLTIREQRWAAEQKAAELLASMAVAAINAHKEISVAESLGDAEKLRTENTLLRERVELLERAINAKGNAS